MCLEAPAGGAITARCRCDLALKRCVARPPAQGGRRDHEPALGALVACLHFAASKIERHLAEPRQMHLPSAERNIECAADHIALARKLNRSASRNRQIEPLEKLEANMPQCERSRHELFDLDVEGQAIATLGILHAEAVFEGCARTGQRSVARYDAAR